MSLAGALLRRVQAHRFSTTPPTATSSGGKVRLRGGNWAAYADDTSRELLLAGPAGTGKTLANLFELYDFGNRHPNSRSLVIRKTRRSLTESALVTWEQGVLGDAHPMLARPINRGNRHQYTFPNGSVLVTGGMDRPDKVLSTEWDRIYVPEATDLTLSDWETLLGRLRGSASRNCQIRADCNPTKPTHWLYKRCQAGKTRLYTTTHRDNPRFWQKGEWTPDGVAYVQGVLGALTGARRKRFLEGVWAEAEGLVYDAYSAERHLLPAGWKAPGGWRRVWGVDWGFRNPIVLQSWAVDGDDRMYLEREFYRTGVRVEHLAEWAVAEMTAGRLVRPSAVVCDHDPECQTTFEAKTGLSLTPADKDDRDAGIQAMQGRFDLAGDGRPRVFFAADALAHPPDQGLADAGKPTSTVEELAGYVWSVGKGDLDKDEPVKVSDHGMDGMRYVAGEIDRGAKSFTVATAPPGQRVMDTLPADTFG